MTSYSTSCFEETSADCLRNSGCGFLYVYGFFARCAAFSNVVRLLCMYTAFDFAHVVRLLRTYTAFAHVVCLLHTYTTFVFTMFNVDSIEVSDLEGSVGFFCQCKCS